MLKIIEVTTQKDESSPISMQTLVAPSVSVGHRGTNVNAVLRDTAPVSNTRPKVMMSETTKQL